MPFTPSEVREKTFGALSRHANPRLIREEGSAFEKAIDDPNSTDNCLDYLRDRIIRRLRANIINRRKQAEKGFGKMNHMSERKIINGRIPGSIKHIDSLYESFSPADEYVDIGIKISMCQCIDTGKYYLHYSKSAHSWSFAVPHLISSTPR